MGNGSAGLEVLDYVITISGIGDNVMVKVDSEVPLPPAKIERLMAKAAEKIRQEQLKKIRTLTTQQRNG